MIEECEAPSSTSATRLIEMARGYQVSQALHAAVHLGLADLLVDGPMSCDDLSRAAGCDATALHRLMRVLASRGIFSRRDDGRFDLAALGRLMRRDVPGSVRGQLLLWGHPMQWTPWGDLLHSVRTGKPAFERIFGMGHWEYLACNAEAGEMFKDAMAAHPSHAETPAAYDFSDLEVIVDIGGGNGQLLIEILSANPHARGVLVERPDVAASARPAFKTAGLDARCQAIGGDFFVDMPHAADAYILSNVLMDWDDSAAEPLLRRCREAMTADGRLLIIERMIPADNAPTLSQLGDLMGLVVTGGRIRSEEEFERLLQATGFRRLRTILTAAGYAIIDARPHVEADALPRAESLSPPSSPALSGRSRADELALESGSPGQARG